MAPDILERFEQLVRKRLTPVDASWRIESVNGVIRAMGPSASPFDNSVCWAEVDEGNADAVIHEQIEHFRRLGRSFMWKVYSHDTPRGLEARLVQAGFEVHERVALVALDTRSSLPPARLPSGFELRRIEEPAGLLAAMEVQKGVWNEDFGWLLGALTEELKTRPDLLSVFVGWAGARPVASSWLRVEEGSPFASLWGGSVHPEFRGQGLYRAMVEARAHEARQRNIAHLLVEAGPMSRPILERLGFRVLAEVSKCIYRGPAPP
jgi:GNAT superfamily N-acetyltransferase